MGNEVKLPSQLWPLHKPVSLLAVLLLLGACAVSSQTDRLRGRAKADALVAGYARHLGEGDAHLDGDDDRSFGDFGFHFESQRRELDARVYIVKADLKDWGPAAAAATRKTVSALNDPRIGGMFETKGGHFVLDEEKDIIFLIKPVAIDVITQSEFDTEVDDFRGLASVWVTRWFKRVARMAHGHEPPPAYKITRQNNPYPL